jgi:hypothetical protein
MLNRLRAATLAVPPIIVLTATGAFAGCPSIFRGAVNTPNDASPLSWNCPAGFAKQPYWFALFFDLQNQTVRRTSAVKMQANLVDAFGDIVQTWSFTENANLGSGDLDTAIWNVRESSAVQSSDHVDLYVLAIKYQDGSVWRSPTTPKVGPTPGPDDRFSRSP